MLTPTAILVEQMEERMSERMNEYFQYILCAYKDLLGESELVRHINSYSGSDSLILKINFKIYSKMF